MAVCGKISSASCLLALLTIVVATPIGNLGLPGRPTRTFMQLKNDKFVDGLVGYYGGTARDVQQVKHAVKFQSHNSPDLSVDFSR